MNLPFVDPQISHYRHLSRLEAARTMADRPSAVDAGLTLDDAYAAISAVETHYGLNPLAGKVAESDEPATELGANKLFNLAVAIDTILSHGNADETRQAATFAAELVTALPHSTEPDKKRTILAGILGIDIPSDVPVAQQLVERRLLPNGTAEQQIALTGLVTACIRTVDTPTAT